MRRPNSVAGVLISRDSQMSQCSILRPTTKGPKVFNGSLPPEMFPPTRTLAANQGLYNGFLAAGLVWALLIGDAVWARHVATFFLGCVAVAGVYGAATASRRIFFVQALPALVALAAVLLGW